MASTRSWTEAYLRETGLDVKLLRESAFIEAHHARGEDVGYLAERGFQLNDMFHVLTGFDTTPLGEVRVVSFTVAQTPAPYPAMIIASRPLQMVLYKPELLPAVMDAITEAYDGDIQMIDSSVVRVHQHAANVKKATRFIGWAAPEAE